MSCGRKKGFRFRETAEPEPPEYAGLNIRV